MAGGGARGGAMYVRSITGVGARRGAKEHVNGCG